MWLRSISFAPHFLARWLMNSVTHGASHHLRAPRGWYVYGSSDHRVASPYAWPRSRPVDGHQYARIRSRWSERLPRYSVSANAHCISRSTFADVLPRKPHRKMRAPHQFSAASPVPYDSLPVRFIARTARCNRCLRPDACPT
jgi:hypothetical protein